MLSRWRRPTISRWSRDSRRAVPTQALAETGEQEAISRPPARPLHLGLEDAELVPEDQELQPEVGVRVMSIDQGLEE